ncbi:hypothetical protein GGX14DRAFT_405675 [Mycena pura]|uniref:Uncharacterized protein n=1 Tax=Mycena pura TaxID=153505 RepID=A0AAD6UTE2_9AGAR|nr:hypothetical protein GGX14DRAFT_405675 [Mycena pura]
MPSRLAEILAPTHIMRTVYTTAAHSCSDSDSSSDSPPYSDDEAPLNRNFVNYSDSDSGSHAEVHSDLASHDDSELYVASHDDSKSDLACHDDSESDLAYHDDSDIGSGANSDVNSESRAMSRQPNLHPNNSDGTCPYLKLCDTITFCTLSGIFPPTEVPRCDYMAACGIVDISQPVRSFCGPLAPTSFKPDAPISCTDLQLATALSGAHILSEPDILARHNACRQKGFFAIDKAHLLEISIPPYATLGASFSHDLELLYNVLTHVETRPRFGARSNGFRLKSESYNAFIQMLTTRKRHGLDGFRLHGRRSPTIPSWGDGACGLDEFYTLSDFEILAVCFRVEVEHFLFQLHQFYDFKRRRPFIKPRETRHPSSSSSLNPVSTRRWNTNSHMDICGTSSVITEFETPSQHSSSVVADKPIARGLRQVSALLNWLGSPSDGIRAKTETYDIELTKTSHSDVVAPTTITQALPKSAHITRIFESDILVRKVETQTNVDVQTCTATLQLSEGSVAVAATAAHDPGPRTMAGTLESLQGLIGQLSTAIIFVPCLTQWSACFGLMTEVSLRYKQFARFRLAQGIG